MKDDNENINFELMPDFGKMLPDENEVPKEEPIVVEKEYDSLYEELLDKCDRNNFLTPFILEKFNLANELYSQLLAIDDKSDDSLRLIRNRCIDELGIKISTKKKYDFLLSVLDLKLYLNDPYYTPDKIAQVAEIYNKLLIFKDDIRNLEQIEADAQDIIEDYDDHSFKIYTKSDYLIKFPHGKHADEARKIILIQEEEQFFKEKTPQEYLEKYPNGLFSSEAREKSEILKEKYCFENLSAQNYLKSYPNGKYAQEALFYINNMPKDYLKQYSDGRYRLQARDKIEEQNWFIIAGSAAIVIIGVIILAKIFSL
ncbi:MAG: hypothetical protein II401_02655 [Bacteroidales bacterium]|nr:hypothetical protein [Bacteroidales bacterium]